VTDSSSGDSGSGDSGLDLPYSVSLSAGGGFGCAIRTNGRVYCWGDNSLMQLGYGLTPGQLLALKASSYQVTSGTKTLLSGIAQVVAGNFGNFSCALASDGTVYCWGNNTSGQVGRGNTSNSLMASQVLGPDGITPLGGIGKIGVGANHACAVTFSTGEVYCWGSNDVGQLGISSAATTLSTVARKVVGIGGVGFLTGMIQITAGIGHTCATNGSSAYCWGGGTYGQLGAGAGVTGSLLPLQVPSLSSVSEVSAGDNHTCARTASGAAYCWGFNGQGQLGNATTANNSSPQTVTGLSTVTQVVAGGHFSCAVKSDGSMYCWGDNSFGMLGQNSTSNYSSPVQVKDSSGLGFLSGVTFAAAGESQPRALSKRRGSFP